MCACVRACACVCVRACVCVSNAPGMTGAGADDAVMSFSWRFSDCWTDCVWLRFITDHVFVLSANNPLREGLL